MPHNYEQALSRALADMNDLLELQIEVQLASLESHEAFVAFNAQLERIKERRNKSVPVRPTPRLIQMGRVE